MRLSQIVEKVGAELFKGKTFFYTLAGAVAGAAIEHAAEALTGYWSSQRTEFLYSILVVDTFVVDMTAAVILVVVGVLFAQIGAAIEHVDRTIKWEADLKGWRLAMAEWRERGSVSFETLVTQLDDLKDTRKNEEKKRYPKVVCRFFVSMLLLAVTFIGLVFGHELSSPIIHFFKCEPCVVTSGESCNLSWSLGGTAEAFINGDRVPVRGSRTVRPEQSTTYYLLAVNPDGKVVETKLPIRVQEPSPLTPTLKPSPSPTPADVSEPTSTLEVMNPNKW